MSLRTCGATSAIYHWVEGGRAVSGQLEGSANAARPGHAYVIAYVDRALSSDAPAVVLVEVPDSGPALGSPAPKSE